MTREEANLILREISVGKCKLAVDEYSLSSYSYNLLSAMFEFVMFCQKFPIVFIIDDIG